MNADHAIRTKCFHPTGKFIEFKKEEIEQSIPDRFEKMVRLYPDRLAVKTRDHQLTYDQLNNAANRVARAILKQRGEGEEPIALLLERNTPLIATIIGVLKAGKIYVLFDPSYPQARINTMLKDSQAGLIVTNNRNFSLTSELAHDGRQVLNIDMIDARVSTENLGLSISLDTPTSIMYTSGSTGQSKGLVKNHRNWMHNTMTNTNDFHICAQDRLTVLGSPRADIFRALLNGAAILPLNIKQEGLANLANWLTQEEITILHSVPSAFRHFVNTLTGDEKFPNLRLIKLAGEPVIMRDVELYKKHFSRHCVLVNQLGTTETGRFRHYLVDKDTKITSSMVPVGYAVNDMTVALLDDDGKEVGFSRIGEIAVKSRYLSPGYWRRPDLTQASFLLDPAGGEERIYRTGDLGRMLPDGCLEHLGRKDFQVKIRGNRVEVTETEMALLELDTVKEAVVVAQEDVPGNKRLVAYIVPTRKPGPTVSALRGALAEKLPDYMIPSVFVKMDSLPLTSNGKVDRKALPLPDNSRPELETPFVAPRSLTEERLAKIWAEVLRVDRVGIHDNFFDLGGHSLLATRVISRVISTFKLELPIKTLFESPTVAEMAQIIIHNKAKLAGNKELARMLAELETLSDEEAKRLLADESKSGK